MSGMEPIKRDYAMQLLRAKFAGRIPYYITPKECLELMNEISEAQTKRAEMAEKLYLEAKNVTPNSWFLGSKP
jgi:hypothetical protein